MHHQLHQADGLIIACLTSNGRFNDLKQIIHVDEKWFFVAEIDKKCYLLPDEDPKYRTCKHKSHIEH
jgi:hypothetical protein